MTEQQIERLQEILNQPESKTGLSELDHKILTEARRRAGDASQTRMSFFSWLFGPGLSTFGYLSAASLAVVATLVTLFGLGHLTGVQPSEVAEHGEQRVLEFKLAPSEPSEPITSDQQQQLAAPERPDTRSELDKWLMETELPDTEELLAGLVFSPTADQNSVRNSIALAMDEIRFLLLDGEIDNARSRYALLKENCSDCDLPDTLEALVLSGPGHSANT